MDILANVNGWELLGMYCAAALLMAVAFGWFARDDDKYDDDNTEGDE